MRYQQRDLPDYPCVCPMIFCIYHNKVIGGGCDNPRNNKGNSDAKCHRKSNKWVVEIVKKAID